MDRNRCNGEGYQDLTAYEAIRQVERMQHIVAFMPLVYICSPYRGEVKKNVLRAKRYSAFAVREEVIPITPHLLFPQFMDDDNPKERALAMRFNYVLLGKCKELWVFGEKITEGMDYEIQIAMKRRMKIRYFDTRCREVLE